MPESDSHFKTFLLLSVVILFEIYLPAKGLITGHYYPSCPLALKSVNHLVSAPWSSINNHYLEQRTISPKLNKMNNRPVEQALATLLPTHAQDMPQELRSLALSLVAQSRSSSSSLKPDEEIARPFACAELACKRSVLTLPIELI